MENTYTNEMVGRRCRVIRPVRDSVGRVRFNQIAYIERTVNNLGRRMYLVRFEDGFDTFLFRDEIEVEDE